MKRQVWSLLLAALLGVAFTAAPAHTRAADDKPAADQKAADQKKPDDAKPDDKKPDDKKTADDKKPDDKKPADENAGQADLDKATEKKLSAETLDDLGDVLKYCESALKAGLNPANKQFAEDLYTSTLLQRGTFYTQAVFDRKTGELSPQADQLRALALGDLEKVVARDTKAGPAFLMIAKLENLPGGDPGKAYKAADQAVTLIKDEPNLQTAALIVRGQLQKDPEKQVADFTEALKLTPADAEALRSRAIYYLAHSKNEEALADLKQLDTPGSQNELIKQLIGETLFLLKRNDDAMKAFDEAVKMRPGSPFPYINRARIRAEQNDTKGALDDLDLALKIQNDNPAALFTRARIYQQTNDAAKAQEDIDAALKNGSGRLIPELVRARGLRAMIAAEAGDYKQLIDDMKDLRKIAPQNTDLLEELALLLLRSKQYDEAIARFDELSKLLPKNVGVLTELAFLYMLNKQPEKAIDAFSKVIEVDDKNFRAYRGRGDSYLNLGKHAEAIKDYEAAYKLGAPDDSDMSGLLNNFAWVLATSPDDKLRDGKRSIELGTKACELTEYSKPHILSTLAAGYAETGDFDTAIKWSSKAVEVAQAGVPDPDEDDDVADQLKKELQSYKDKKPVRERLTGDEKKEKKDKEKKSDGDKPASSDSASPAPK